MKSALLVIGFILIIGVIMSGNLSSIADWSTAEMFGYNTFSIVSIIGGVVMVYFGFKKSKKID